jgi:SAM-dependent methyltransferase
MATVDEVERLERERRDADRRYNDALTALDRAILELPSSPALAREDLDRLATALLVFLQQITGFVESKDRAAAAQAGARLAAVDRALAELDELRTRIGVLQRGLAAISAVPPPRSLPAPPSTTRNPQSAIRDSASAPFAYKYVAFEDQFRGSDRDIEAKLGAYVPLFANRRDVVDLGCGRGELLAALGAAGIGARGVDANDAMVAAARERGLDVQVADALGFLQAQPDQSLGGVVATQVVEHLEPGYLLRLLDQAARTLRAGAPIVLETINPACWLAFFSSYVRDLTHVRPVHPDTLQYLLRASGFERVEVRYSAPVPEHVRMKTIDLPPIVQASTDPTSAALAAVAGTVNANAAVLNGLMFTHLDYAAIGYRA